MGTDKNSTACGLHYEHDWHTFTNSKNEIKVCDGIFFSHKESK